MDLMIIEQVCGHVPTYFIYLFLKCNLINCQETPRAYFPPKLKENFNIYFLIFCCRKLSLFLGLLLFSVIVKHM